MLATDYTIEHEWRRIMTGLTGVALYHSRILNDAQITPETLRAMEPRIAALPPMSSCPVPISMSIAYGCTSASMAIGEEKVFERIREARPNVECTTPITAAFAAFRAFGAKRIGVLTPYRADVNRIVASYIAARGFTVPVFGSFNEEDDNIVARITPKSIKEGILAIRKRADIDAVFVSCTSVRLAEAAADIEREIGLPSPRPITPWPGMLCGSPALTKCRNGAGSSRCRWRADYSLANRLARPRERVDCVTSSRPA